MSYKLPPELTRCFGAPAGTRCELALAERAEYKRRAWCRDGVIDTKQVRVVYAISDVHGDGGFFMYWLVRAGLARLEGAKWAWASASAALVVCGDVADDDRSGGGHDEIRDAALYALNFEGFAGAARGSGTWNVLAFINYLVAECDARIVVVLGNHELMNMQSAAGGYKRKVSADVEKARGGWLEGGGMRDLLGTPLVAACAGKLLFMHAEPPIFGAQDVQTEFGAAGAAAEFTRRVNALAQKRVLDPQVQLAVWGRSLGSELAARPHACGTFRLVMPGVTLVRGHCPNRPSAPAAGLVFGKSADNNDLQLLRRASGCSEEARVYVARGPQDLEDGSARGAYAGVVVSCARGRNFGGAVFRIDCMGSLAFDISARLCSVVAFVVATGEVFCLVGERVAI